MEEIKVGEYIRDRGEILKIEVFEKLPYYNNERVLVKFKEYTGSNTYSLKEIEKCKHSFNIIDLIEIGDYVNGYKVLRKIKSNIDGGTIRILLFKNNYSETWQTFSENQIKEIVTHESFNSIKYEVK